MKSFFLTLLLIITFDAFAQVENLFYDCTFENLHNNQYKVEAYFSGSGDNCFDSQVRSEYLRNDTLFLNNLYLFPSVFNAFGCERKDTLQQSILSAEINYINISTGIIYYNTSSGEYDTIRNKFESTFNSELAVPLLSNSNFQWTTSEEHLTVTGDSPIQSLCIYTINGELLLCEDNNQAIIQNLARGVYLMRIIAADQIIVARWYKP